METHSTPNLQQLEVDLQQEYVNILLQEELLWHQRSTCNWNKNGDRNTSFYHAHVKKHATRNNVDMLRLDYGECCSNGDVLKAKTVKFFSRLYSKEGNDSQTWKLKGQFPNLSMEDMEALANHVTKDEV